MRGADGGWLLLKLPPRVVLHDSKVHVPTGREIPGEVLSAFYPPRPQEVW
jgi:hypothetical protein